MKQLAYSALLLAALLAGCSGNPSKEAAIEDRGIKAAEAEQTEGVKIVEASRVETQGAASVIAVSEAANKSGAGVNTSGTATPPVSAKTTESVQTRGATAASSEVKSLADGKPATDAKSGGVAGDGKSTVAQQDGSTLPQPDAVPTWGDLKNPGNPLSKRRLLFDYDSAAIRDEYRPVLEAHVRFMKANKDAKAILQGHADERGSREYNLALGQRRAESVFKAMNLLGVPEAQMEAVSMGEEKPVTEGHDEEAWQQNRRTEILYQGE
ncbi:MAG: peptidoglycan-associated lipoprotein Pal [Pseudomonadota bacterium]|nr:peptidoglycan-associated lipoprotein Pal [Pseudomonadota bacterium]